MEILKNIGWYLIIGTVFTFTVDMINSWLISKKHLIDYEPPGKDSWGLTERIWSIVLWPWAAYIFISAFLRSKKK